MKSIIKKTLRHEAYERIADLIISGELSANERIDENRLSTELGISRTPLREALNRLTQEGIVTDVPYRGMFVKEFSQRQVRETYEVRKVLESTAVRWAMDLVTSKDIAELRVMIAQIAEAQQQSQISEITDIDSDFHMTIARASGNETLIAMIQQLMNQTRLMKQLGNMDRQVAARTHNDRVLIVDALERGERDKAVQHMNDHLEDACQGIIKQLRLNSDLGCDAAN